MYNLKFRKANIGDIEIYYNWVNDPLVRENSYDSLIISRENHVRWFLEKITNPKYIFYLFQNDNNDFVGQVRIQKLDNKESVLSISVDPLFRGLGLGTKLLNLAVDDFFKQNPKIMVKAFIKIDNNGSKIIFEKAKFYNQGIVFYNNHSSYYFTKRY